MCLRCASNSAMTKISMKHDQKVSNFQLVPTELVGHLRNFFSKHFLEISKQTTVKCKQIQNQENALNYHCIWLFHSKVIKQPHILLRPTCLFLNVAKKFICRLHEMWRVDFIIHKIWISRCTYIFFQESTRIVNTKFNQNCFYSTSPETEIVSF